MIESVLEGGEAWPEQPPFSRDDFARLDESDDSLFYDSPKLVQHVDDAAVRALERYYGEALEETAQRMYGQRDRDLDILDLGASWSARQTGSARPSLPDTILLLPACLPDV